MERHFRLATAADIPEMKALWKLCFPEDEEGFIQRFFEKTPATTGLLACKGEILSMLFLLPAQVVTGGQSIPVRYLYAGCTHPAHRGQGIYPALMEYAAQHAATMGAEAIYLCPASASLAVYYHRLGYRDGIGCWERRAETVDTSACRTEVTVTAYFEARRHFLPENRLVWQLEEPFERFFLEEMVRDGWSPVIGDSGCGVLSADGRVGYDRLTADSTFMHAPLVCGADNSGTWRNTALWLPLGSTGLVALMGNNKAYTAFLGDI